jgi:hypothetical protein
LVLGGKITHDHHVLCWMAGNVSIEKDTADNWRPSKKQSIKWIDSIVVLIVVLDGAACNPRPSKASARNVACCGSSLE